MQSIDRSFDAVIAAILAELRSDSEMLEDHVALLERVRDWCDRAIDYTNAEIATGQIGG